MRRPRSTAPLCVWLMTIGLACTRSPGPAVNSAGDVCKTGKLQSPIDLYAIARRGDAALKFAYRPDTLRIVNNGHTVEVEHRADSELWTGEQSYRLVQYHMHSPSEHHVEGKRYPLEIHFVHRNADGMLAVVGVLVEQGEEVGREVQAVAAVWEHLPPVSGGHEELDIEVDPLDLLPASHEHYFYSGSLTTPPCTEKVRWHVLATPLRMSAEHIERFRAIYSDNARPIQRHDWCPLTHTGVAP